MSDYTVIGFQKVYKGLNLKMQKNEPEAFKLGVLVAYASELDKGFGVVKQLKTNSKGTAFNYELIDTKEKAEKYEKKVKEIKEELDLACCAKEILGR